ncbi:MAG: formylglycine-generating enzyme family protein [Phycisphaerales bacterium]|nr:MAG: formylglycine-generating enzyme family protein [Phycisphaerales bacterium]
MKVLAWFLFSVPMPSGPVAPAPEMIFVEAGRFEMGNPFEGADADERPVHAVDLRAYYIGRHEVTVGQFSEFIEDTNYKTTAEQGKGASVLVGTKVETRPDANWRNPYYRQDDRHPVVCVSWYDAVEYCNWRSRREGLRPCYTGCGDDVACNFAADGYRLPTEAEWEYAARSRGKRIKFAWGDGEPVIDGRPVGNTKDEAAKREWGVEKIWQGYDDGYACSAPVCSFAPNELGIHDISGNVYEWVWDWYGADYYATSPVENPTGPDGGEMRACRDAGFGCAIQQESVVTRGLGKPDLTFSWGGFRVARSKTIENLCLFSSVTR